MEGRLGGVEDIFNYGLWFSDLELLNQQLGMFIPLDYET